MIKSTLTLGQLAVLAGTRGLLGVGLGLLLAGKLSPERRKAIGWTLAAAGVFSTLPLAIMVAGKREVSAGEGGTRQADSREERAAATPAAGER